MLLNVYFFEVGGRHNGTNGTVRDKLTGEKRLLEPKKLRVLREKQNRNISKSLLNVITIYQQCGQLWVCLRNEIALHLPTSRRINTGSLFNNHFLSVAESLISPQTTLYVC